MKNCQYPGIYKITNKLNNKVYIGSSKNVRNRLQTHRDRLRRGTHCNVHLQAAYNKYGTKAFRASLIERCEEAVLFTREIVYIEQYDSMNPAKGYNLSIPTECGGTRVIRREIIERNAQHLRELYRTTLVPQNYKGEEDYHEMIAKGLIRVNSQWIPDNGEYKKVNGIFVKTNPTVMMGATHPHSTQIHQLDKEFNIIATYNSIVEAAKAVNGTQSYISAASQLKLKKNGTKSKSHKGYYWKRGDVSILQLKEYVSTRKRKHTVSVQRISKDFRNSQTYSSIKEAAAMNGCSTTSINDVVNMKTKKGSKAKTAKGFYWKKENTSMKELQEYLGVPLSLNN